MTPIAACILRWTPYPTCDATEGDSSRRRPARSAVERKRRRKIGRDFSRDERATTKKLPTIALAIFFTLGSTMVVAQGGGGGRGGGGGAGGGSAGGASTGGGARGPSAGTR